MAFSPAALNSLTPEQIAAITARNPRLGQMLGQLGNQSGQGAVSGVGTGQPPAGWLQNLQNLIQQFRTTGFNRSALDALLAQLGPGRFGGGPGHDHNPVPPGSSPGGNGGGGGGGSTGTGHPPGGGTPPPPVPVAGLPAHAAEISTSPTPGGVKTDYMSGFGPTTGPS